MAPTSPGLRLNAAFYDDVVAPLVAPWRHTAARLGTGSDVLGFDDERSTDHGWGPALLILVEPAALPEVAAAVDQGLPDSYGGWPVRYGWDDTPVDHHVRVTTLHDWLRLQLGIEQPDDLRTTDWLLLPQQRLLEVTKGAVYHDDTGELGRAREALTYYPTQVWLWMLACQWRRIAQEEAFIGRTAEVGDELGSRIVAARIARELMRLWFLFDRSYWPYTKWFGSAFQRLAGTHLLGDPLDAALAARNHQDREEALKAAYEIAADRHNALAVTAPLDVTTRRYFRRPYQVLMADRFVQTCLAEVDDPALRALPLVGSVDQFADSTDILSHSTRPRLLARLYEARESDL